MPIASNSVNAVAMTVMPDAPCDPATGLQVPTIAVATAGGVSIIQNTGAVVSSGSTVSFNSIGFTDRPRELIATWGGGETAYRWNNLGSLAAGFPLGTSLNSLNAPYLNSSGVVQTVTPCGGGMFASRNTASAKGVSLVKPNNGTWGNGLAAYVTPAYATGWMAGDIRRAYLADTLAGVVGPSVELVTNGTFATDTSGWTPAINTALGVAGGAMQVTNTNAAASGYGFQSVATVPGKSYRFSVDFVAVSGGATFDFRIGTGTSDGSLARKTAGGAALGVTGTFTAVGTTTYLNAFAFNSASTLNSTASYDNISVQEVVADRSYKGSTLTITGTLTRTAVAAAAQLVAYSGFSAANYLQEGYSADLDPGTGQWHATVFGSLPTTLTAAMFPQVGAQLAGNSNFADASVWAAGAGVTVGGGQAVFNNVASGVGLTQTLGGAAAGKFYVVSVTISAISNGSVSVRIGGGGFLLTAATPGTYSLLCPATSSTGLQVLSSGGGGSFTITSVTAYELGNAWAYDRSAAAGAYYRAGCNPGGFLVAELYDGTTTRTVTSPAAYNTGQPFKASASYTTDGTLTLSVGGAPVATATGAPLLTLSNANAVLTVGNRRTLDAAWPGSLALLKIGATVPTVEASAFMYAQEAQMFQPGAQVTLPDSGAVVDMDYDPVQDKWKVVSAANESSFVGLVRTGSSPVSAGSFAKVVHKSGIKLLARSTTNPGVDITIPAKNALEEFNKRAEDAAQRNAPLQTLDWVGGFTANTSIAANPNALQNITAPPTNGWPGAVYPTGSTVAGAQISGAGIPAGTAIGAFEGTTVIRMSGSATAAGTAVPIAFTDFILPVGFEAFEVFAGAQGSAGLQKEGATGNYQRLFDGFRERVRFTTAPGATAHVRVNARKAA